MLGKCSICTEPQPQPSAMVLMSVPQGVKGLVPRMVLVRDSRAFGHWGCVPKGEIMGLWPLLLSLSAPWLVIHVVLLCHDEVQSNGPLRFLPGTSRTMSQNKSFLSIN